MHDRIELSCEGQEKEAKQEGDGVAALLFNIPVVQGYWANLDFAVMKAGDGPERVGE